MMRYRRKSDGRMFRVWDNMPPGTWWIESEEENPSKSYRVINCAPSGPIFPKLKEVGYIYEIQLHLDYELVLSAFEFPDKGGVASFK